MVLGAGNGQHKEGWKWKERVKVNRGRKKKEERPWLMEVPLSGSVSSFITCCRVRCLKSHFHKRRKALRQDGGRESLTLSTSFLCAHTFSFFFFSSNTFIWMSPEAWTSQSKLIERLNIAAGYSTLYTDTLQHGTHPYFYINDGSYDGSVCFYGYNKAMFTITTILPHTSCTLQSLLTSSWLCCAWGEWSKYWLGILNQHPYWINNVKNNK